MRQPTQLYSVRYACLHQTLQHLTALNMLYTGYAQKNLGRFARTNFFSLVRIKCILLLLQSSGVAWLLTESRSEKTSARECHKKEREDRAVQCIAALDCNECYEATILSVSPILSPNKY